MEKQLGKKAELFAASPLLNLVCIAFEDGDVVLQRVATWQRVWALSQTGFGSARATTIAWKPDGKAIAFGFDDGFVRIVDVESSEVQRNVNAEGPVQYLKWTTLKSAERTNVLIVALNDGSIRLFADGALHVATFSVRSDADAAATGFKGSTYRFEQVDFTEQFSELIATFTVNQSASLFEDEGESAQDAFETSVQVACFDTRLFAATSDAFERVASRLVALQQAIDVLSDALNALAENWHDVVLECERKLSNYATRFHENDRKMALGNDLLEFALFGTCSVDLDHFLENELAEKVLEKLCEQTRTAFSEVQRIVVETMLPKLHNLLFRVHELDCFVDAHSLLVEQATCMCELQVDVASDTTSTLPASDTLIRFGIQPAVLRDTLKIAAALLGRTNELLAVTESASSSLHTFLVWLRDAVRERNTVTLATSKPTGTGNRSLDELKQVVAFIKDNLCNEKVALDNDGRNGGQLRAVHNLIRVASPRIGTQFASLLLYFAQSNRKSSCEAALGRGAEFDAALAEADCVDQPLATLVELLGDALERLFCAFRQHVSLRYFSPNRLAHTTVSVAPKLGFLHQSVELAGTVPQAHDSVIALLFSGYRFASPDDDSSWSALFLRTAHRKGCHFDVQLLRRVSVSFELLSSSTLLKAAAPARLACAIDYCRVSRENANLLKAKSLFTFRDDRSKNGREYMFANVSLDLAAVFNSAEPVWQVAVSTSDVIGSFVESDVRKSTDSDPASTKWTYALFGGSHERVCLVSRDRLNVRVHPLKT